MVEISTSILSIKKEEAMKTFYELEVAHTDYFHIDVMDGKFVPKNTLQIMKEYASSIKHISNIPLDVHFMVEEIKENILEYLELQPNIMTFHIEAVKNKQEGMDLIKLLQENNIKVGIAIKPNTDISEVYDFLPYIHMVLIMTVEPGLGGQKLIPETIEKVRRLKQYLDRNQIETDIEVDGGIKEVNVMKLIEAGANIIVAGTAIVDSDDYTKTIDNLKNE